MATAGLLLLTLLMATAGTDASTLSVSVAQSHLLVAAGADATMQCQFSDSVEYLLWGYVTGSSNQQIAMCYMNSCSPSSGDPLWQNTKAEVNGTFRIVGVTQSQDGKFECKGIGPKGLARKEVTLTVVVGSGVPNITRSSASPTSGEVLSLGCSSAGANPLVRLSWLLKTKDGVVQNLTKLVAETRLPSSKFGESKSVVRLTVTAAHHGALVTCVATQEATGLNWTASSPLLVQHKPTAAVMPNITTIEGNTVSVTCLAEGHPTPVISLTRPNGTAVRGGVAGTFTLVEMYRSEAGIFTCTARNSLGVGHSSFGVRVLHPPSVSAPEQVTVSEGQPVTLPCFVTGDPPPDRVEWLHDASGDRPPVNGTNLTLPRARVEQAGLWICRVEVKLTPTTGKSVDYSTSASVRLRVLYRPGVPAAPQPLGPVRSGDRVALNCSANRNRPGEPPPLLVWTRADGAAIDSDAETGRLTLPTAGLSHSGVYFCRAKNSQGESRSAARVSLSVVQAPKIIDPPDSRRPIMARLGDKEFQLTCTVAANPQPTMRWMRLGRDLADATEFLQQMRPTEQTHIYSLILLFRGDRRPSVSLNDTGAFKCVAFNDFGADSANFTLEVMTKPRITNRLHKVALVSGERLSCEFHSHRGFSVAWQRSGDALPLPGNWSAATRPEAPFVHTSAGPSGAGNFTCLVSNSLGSDSAKFSVVSESVPDPPQSLKVRRVSWNSFDVAWLPGFSGGHPTRLRLLVTGWNASAAEEVTAVFEADADAGVWTVGGLFPDTTYRLRARAHNALGEGAEADVLHVVTRHLQLPEVAEPLWQPMKGSFEFKGTEGYCAAVRVSEDSGVTWRTIGACRPYSAEGYRITFSDSDHLYRVALCLEERREICGTPYTTYTVAQVSTVSFELIAGVASGCSVLILVLTAVLLGLCCRRRLDRSEEAEKKLCDKSQPRPSPLSGSLPRYHQQHQQHQRPSVAYVSPTVTENLSNQTQDTHDTCVDGSSCSGNHPPSPPLLQTSPYAPLQVFPSSFCESDTTDRSNESPPSPARVRRVVYEVVV